MSAFGLARWFQTERYANRPEDDFLREEILDDLYANGQAVACQNGTVLVRTANGAAMIERRDEQGSPLVVIDYVRHDRWERTNFWMNASSVSDLGERLRALPRESFDVLFAGQS
jgi:hypothetical protein